MSRSDSCLVLGNGRIRKLYEEKIFLSSLGAATSAEDEHTFIECL